LTHRGFPEDIDNAANEFHCRAPRLTLVGSYKVNGRVLVLPITGTGQSNLTLGEGIEVDRNFATKLQLYIDRWRRYYVQI
jgi:Haemolymph juvenile hormone binding protein (JHBP)